MSRKKQTFVDPETGEEIASTRLARWGAGMGLGLSLGLMGGLLMGVGVGVIEGPIRGVMVGLFTSLLAGLSFGLFHGLVFHLLEIRQVRSEGLYQRIHDRIARRQHRRHKQRLRWQRWQDQLRRNRRRREKEWAHVPDGALSRAQTPGEPVPTDAALSRTDSHDGKEHLAGTAENSPEAEVSVPR